MIVPSLSQALYNYRKVSLGQAFANKERSGLPLLSLQVGFSLLPVLWPTPTHVSLGLAFRRELSPLPALLTPFLTKGLRIVSMVQPQGEAWSWSLLILLPETQTITCVGGPAVVSSPPRWLVYILLSCSHTLCLKLL